MDELKKHIQQNLEFVEDTEIPSKEVFNRIISSVNQEKKVNTTNTKAKVFVLIKYLAAACVIGLAVVGAVHLLSTKPQTETVINNKTRETNNEIDTTKNTIAITNTTNKKDTPLTVVANFAKDVINKVATAKIDDDTIAALAAITTGNYSVLANLKFVDSQYAQLVSVQKKAINTLPVYAENAAYFSSFSQDFKQIEYDEKQIKKDIVNIGLNEDLLNQLINVYQQKLDILKNLQNEINKTNTKFKQNRTNTDTIKAYYLSI